MLDRLRNVRITNLPRIEPLTRPIGAALKAAMAGQVVGSGGLGEELLEASPKEAPWSLSLGVWLDKLKSAEKILHNDASFGVYYRRFRVNENFAEETYDVKLKLIQDLYAIKVVKANSRGES